MTKNHFRFTSDFRFSGSALSSDSNRKSLFFSHLENRNSAQNPIAFSCFRAAQRRTTFPRFSA